jgi:hypothetical protein
MDKQRMKELFALAIVGDSVLTAIEPTRHLTLWKRGPKRYSRAVEALIRRPKLTRALGVAGAVIGVWWASRQKPKSWSLLRRSA